MSRRSAAALAILIVAAGAGAMAIHVASRSGPAEVEVLRAPGSLCSEFAAHPYAEQVDDVRSTEPAQLRTKVASVRASYLRRTAAIEGPGAASDLLELLAAGLEVGTASGDLTAAADTAAQLDALAAERC